MALGDVLGGAAQNDSARQLFVWGVLYGLISSVFLPVTTTIEQEAWQVAVEANLHRALTPDELAVQVVRGWRDEANGEAEAVKSGIAQNDFASMVANRRNPIPPEEAAVALRRQIIPQDAAAAQPSFSNAIRQGNLGDQWGPVIQALAKTIPTPADVLQAYLEGQIGDEATARALYTATGGLDQDAANNVDWFQLMFETRGSAPTPMEALTMLNRGIIPQDGQGPLVTSYHQAFLEGPWRNKWEAAFLGLRAYLPPPRTVTAMLRSGGLTPAQALDLLTKQGLSPELAAAYIADASHGRTTAQKQLNVSTIEQLFLDKAITQAEAEGYLTTLGYTTTEADLILQTATLRQTHSDLTKNITRIASYYIAHKIDQPTASTMLSNLGLPADQVTHLLQGWSVDRQANVRRLSEAQVVAGWFYKNLTIDEAMAALEADGLTPFDAWVVLSNRNKGPLPNKPAPGPPPIQ
jgi:hypothetical protein